MMGVGIAAEALGRYVLFDNYVPVFIIAALVLSILRLLSAPR
jgi:hypothetical protein